jgi:hypothetical protein
MTDAGPTDAVAFALDATARHDGDPVAAVVAVGLAGSEEEALAPLGALLVGFERVWGRYPTRDEQHALALLAASARAVLRALS